MKELIAKGFERNPNESWEQPFLQQYLLVNQEQLKRLADELFAKDLPASAVASVLRLPRDILETIDEP